MMAAVEMDPKLSVRAGHAPEVLCALRRASFEEQGFVIVDDFEGHPLLPRMLAAAREITALANNSSCSAAWDPAVSYVHRTSALRGESRLGRPQWTGGSNVFSRAEAWAVRGLLHPAWRAEGVDDQPVFAEFLASEAVLGFVHQWCGMGTDDLGLMDATVFCSPPEADFSEGWHRDVRWHGGKNYLQQETDRQLPDTSEAAERKRWAELQAEFHLRRRGNNGGDEVAMFLALAPDQGCHEIVPASHLAWRSAEERSVLRPLGFDWTMSHFDREAAAAKRHTQPGLYQHGLHTPLSSGRAVMLRPGQGLIRNGATIHRGRTRHNTERTTLSWTWSRAPPSSQLPPSAIDSRSFWMLSPAVRAALPTVWMQEAYDRWRSSVQDDFTLATRLNANELERLSPAAKRAAKVRGSAMRPAKAAAAAGAAAGASTTFAQSRRPRL